MADFCLVAVLMAVGCGSGTRSVKTHRRSPDGRAIMVSLQNLCGRYVLEDHARKGLQTSVAKRYLVPYNLAGGPALLRSTVNPNPFAAPLAPLLQRYFS